jgi:hypothetical protein
LVRGHGALVDLPLVAGRLRSPHCDLLVFETTVSAQSSQIQSTLIKFNAERTVVNACSIFIPLARW